MLTRGNEFRSHTKYQAHILKRTDKPVKKVINKKKQKV